MDKETKRCVKSIYDIPDGMAEVKFTIYNTEFFGQNLDGSSAYENLEGDFRIFMDGWKCFGPTETVSGTIDALMREIDRLTAELERVKGFVSRVAAEHIGMRDVEGVPEIYMKWVLEARTLTRQEG